MKLKNTKRSLYASLSVTVLVVLVAIGFGVNAYVGNSAPKVVVEGDYIEASQSGEGLGAVSGPNVFYDMVFYSSVKMKNATYSYAPTASTTTLTLDSKDSGTTYLLSASGTTITLPSVAYTGTNYRFAVSGALDDANVIIDSAEGDNIEGTLIVAGAVVDCDAEDQINFIVDGENIGDYFEIMSDGTQWLLGDSGVLTAAKLTCTDPS